MCFMIKLKDFKRYLMTQWGRSSAGRAPALHAGGQEFDPPRLHQNNYSYRDYSDDTFFVERCTIWSIQTFIKNMVKIEETQA